VTDVENVDAALDELGMSARDLWIGYFAVGGNGSLTEVEQWLAGSSDPSRTTTCWPRPSTTSS